MLKPSIEVPHDLVFEAEEDLYESPTGQILLLKHSSKVLALTRNRTF